jgi:predicted HTH domain antitoxin
MENVVISGALLEKMNVTSTEFLTDLACYLYDKGRFSFGQARQLAQLGVLDFQKALKIRNIYLKYDETDLATDLKNLGLC